ncbi:MAG: methionyl-tRNA formyltransferase [Chloroflexi bacterium]|nr:MAG: methionyl-tRNA formyltransferase [Chloroflexota bacterium]
MAIVFIGTPAFAVSALKRIVAAGYEVSAVFTQPDRPAGRGRLSTAPAVKAAAEGLGLPVYQPASLKDSGVVEQLRALAPEMIVGVAYGQLIVPEVLSIPPRGVLNVHPSLLPRWRGASPVAAAIVAGDEETGVTIMLMDEGLDSGPILSQRVLAISPADTAGSLTEALAEEGADLLAETLPRWLAGEIEPQPQDEPRATVCRRLSKADGLIDWAQTATEIWRQVRAYNPWPGAHSSLDGETMSFWRAWPIDAGAGEPPGTVLAAPDDLPAEAQGAAFVVQTGHGALAVLEAQRAGRRSLASADLLRGMPALIGRRFSVAE